MKREAAEYLIKAGRSLGVEVDLYQTNPVRGLTDEPVVGVVCREPWKLLAAAIATAANQHPDESPDPDTLWSWFKDLNERSRGKTSILH